MSGSEDDAFGRLSRAAVELAQTLKRLEPNCNAESRLAELISELETQEKNEELLARLKKAVGQLGGSYELFNAKKAPPAGASGDALCLLQGKRNQAARRWPQISTILKAASKDATLQRMLMPRESGASLVSNTKYPSNPRCSAPASIIV